ncbi:MAG: hypothetical protein FJX54_00775 [Alphaproteobacteria bacterium]|nr:hypothetical protein [Alphaproteobacteria bacterium]
MTLTASGTLPTGLAQLARRPYSPHSCRFIRRQDLGDWRMKVYGIAARPGHDARPGLVDATVDLARQWLPKDVLANPAGPDLDRYLSRRTDADL